MKGKKLRNSMNKGKLVYVLELKIKDKKENNIVQCNEN